MKLNGDKGVSKLYLSWVVFWGVLFSASVSWASDVTLASPLVLPTSTDDASPQELEFFPFKVVATPDNTQGDVPSTTIGLEGKSTGQSADTICIKKIEIEGNTVFTDEQLLDIKEVKDIIPRLPATSITFAQLLQIRTTITQFYIDQGYITSGAYIPEQPFFDNCNGNKNNGVVLLKVVEGKLSDITVKPSLQEEYIKQALSILGVKKDIPLNQTTLIQALQRLQSDPRIEKLDVKLLPGDQPGRNRLEVTVTEQPCNSHSSPACFAVLFDVANNRSPSVGGVGRRLSVDISNLYAGYNTSKPNDLNPINLNLSYTNADAGGVIDFAFDIAKISRYNDPWSEKIQEKSQVLFKFNQAWNNVIEQPFNQLDINSNTRRFDISLRVEEGRYVDKFAWFTTLSWQQSSTTLLGIPFPLSRDANDVGETRIFALRGGVESLQQTSSSALALRGELSIGTNVSPKEGFAILRGQGQWVQQLAPEMLFLTRLNVQLASGALPALEQAVFGGADTLRGYRQNFLLADNGVNASLELQLPILQIPEIQGVVQITPFVDFSTGWNWGNSQRDSLDIPPLWSTGVGLQVRLGDHFRARVDWAVPLVTVNSRGESLPQENLSFSISGGLTF